MEGVAEFVAFGVVGAVAVATLLGHIVLAEGLLLEVRVDLGECFFADPAVAARGQLPAVAALLDVAGFFQQLQQLL